MNRTTILIALALGGSFAVSCVQTSFSLNPDYCSGAQDGDSFCAEMYPDGSKPYCRSGTSACENGAEPEFDGCVAERPEDECYSPCGQGNTLAEDASCLDDATTVAEGTEGTDTGSGSETDTLPTSTTVQPETETAEDSSTTTGPACMGNEECDDPTAPFCVAGECSPCSAVVGGTPDEACAGLDPALPLCVEGSCVACTPENFEACGDDTPLCGPDNMCVGCEFHEQCQDLGSPACNIETGACFDPANVSEADGGTAGDIQSAIDDVADGETWAIELTGGATNHTLTVDGGKTIALVSSDATTQRIEGNSGAPTLTVTGAGTTAYLHRLELTLNGDDVGVAVESGATLYADSVQVAQNAGGGITLGSGTTAFLRNCMVAGVAGNPGEPAVLSAGDLDILYSTLGLGFNPGTGVLQCSGGNASVRNSIVVSETSAGGSEVACPGSMLPNTAVESTLSPGDWFGAGFTNGSYSLSPAGATEFEDVAIWETGDPPFDFEGTDRPAVDGERDYAGADVP